MGVDIAMIIPTKQRSKRNHEECVRCLNDAIAQVELFFHQKKHFVSSKYIERENEDLLNEFPSEELDMYSFYVPFLDGSDFCLFAGFWCITNGYRYWQYFCKQKDKQGHWHSYQRELFFDAVRMLGGKEGWLCDDLNVEEFADYKDDAFDAWLRHEEGKPWGVVHDFDISEAINTEDNGFPDYWPKYHDSFKECFELLHEYQMRFPQYEILTIHPIGDYIIIAAGDDIYLMNPDTGKFLTDFPIEGIKEYDFNSVTIYHGDEYAKFSYKGELLTKFQNEQQ